MPETDAETDTSTSSELRAERERALLALVDAENRLALDELAELFPNPRYELIGTHRVYEGTEAVTRYLKERRAAFPDLRSEVAALHHADDAIIAEFWLTGTQLGTIEGITPSGRAFRCRMAGFFLFSGATLTCERIYFDTGTIARQLA